MSGEALAGFDRFDRRGRSGNFVPRRVTPTSADRRRRFVAAVSTDCMALCDVAAGMAWAAIRFARRRPRGQLPRRTVRPTLFHVSSRPNVRPPPAGFMVALSRRVGCSAPVGTGVEPVTARFMVWCSASELTTLNQRSHRQNPFAEHTRPTGEKRRGLVRRWPGYVRSCL